MIEKHDPSFDLMPEQFGKALDEIFQGVDADAVKEMVTFVRSQLETIGKSLGNTADMGQVMKMMDSFFQRLAMTKELKAGGLKAIFAKTLLKVVDAAIKGADPEFAKEYDAQLQNAIQTYDGVAALRLMARVAGSAAYVRDTDDVKLSGKIGQLLATKFEETPIGDLVVRKKEVKSLGVWTMSEELALPTAQGMYVGAPVGEKILSVFIKTEPPEAAGVYEKVATDVVVRSQNERETHCPKCGAQASANPYRTACESCGTIFPQETLSRVISERVHKLKQPAKMEEPVIQTRPPVEKTKQQVREVISRTDFEVSNGDDVEVDAGPYRDITISNCDGIAFEHTRATGSVDISNVDDLSGDLTVSEDSDINISNANDCRVSIVRANNGETAVGGSLSISGAGNIDLSSTHRDITISQADDINFDSVVAFGDVVISNAGKISGTLTFVGGGTLQVSNCGEQKLKVTHE